MEPLIDLFDENAEPNLLEPSQLQTIKRLWADEGVEECYDRRREYQVFRHSLNRVLFWLSKAPNYASSVDHTIVRVHRKYGPIG